MKKILSGILLGIATLALVTVPVLASYWAYLVVEENNGNSYENLPVMCSRNITQLVNYDIITATGLDTRVLTGDGYPLPHMLANDRICFVTDLAVDEEKQLIFYTGATSLSSFPIIVGYDGYITTEDDEDLELTYVLELLVSGYFDASVGSDKNILYKEDAFKLNISAANTLRVAALEAGDVEQWEMHYSSFTSGVHTVYVVSDGMQASLYVDNFVTPKDTQNLWENGSYSMTAAASATNVYMGGRQHYNFYASGRFWCFYLINDTTIGWRSSTDGVTWAAEQTVAVVGGDAASTSFSVVYRDGYLHIVYGGYVSGGDDHVRYRRGSPETDGTIVWSADWQVADTLAAGTAKYGSIAVDDDGYPFITYTMDTGSTSTWCIKSSANNGTWSMAVGYPFEIVAGEGTAIYSYYGETNDDMYILYYHQSSYWLYGKDYNGSAWASPESISGMTVTQFDTVSDSEGNLYVVWDHNAGTHNEVYLRIRYSTGVWSSITKIAGEVGASVYEPTVSYNPTTDGIYIFYYKPSDAHAYGYVFIEDTLIGPYTYGAFSTYPGALTSTPYSDHIGIVAYVPASKIEHQFLTFSWDWNDNENDWYWMQNNVMPYADYFQVGIDGELVLHYQPATIIQGTTLPDVESDHDGIITWGGNPAGVSCYLTPFETEDAEEDPIIASSPNSTAPPDMVGPTGQPDYMEALPTLEDNPFYPIVNFEADLLGIPVGIIWIFLATLAVLVAMYFTYKNVPHLDMTLLVGGGLSAFFYAMGIYPFWVMFIFFALAFAIVVKEHSASMT